PYASMATIPNRDAAIETVRREGAKVVVGYFSGGSVNSEPEPGAAPLTSGWRQLDGTPFYALPLNPSGGTVLNTATLQR
ncbi:MAG TPA: hypothetical protein VF214_10665, partial [Edaphobacter sp.]